MTPIPEPIYYRAPPEGGAPRCRDCRHYPAQGRDRDLCTVHLCAVHALTFAPEECYAPRSPLRPLPWPLTGTTATGRP